MKKIERIVLCGVFYLQLCLASKYNGTCKIVFNNSQLASNETSVVVQNCLQNSPMETPNATATEEEKMEVDVKNDHNCAMKCINDHLNVTTDTGRVDVRKILEHFQASNATTKYVQTLALLLGGCEKEIEQKMQLIEDNEDESYLCKYHIMFMRCYRDAYMTSHLELKKNCKE